MTTWEDHAIDKAAPNQLGPVLPLAFGRYSPTDPAADHVVNHFA